ncbi:uncharacterized protein [Amphiura filiformis]|uniref:uncharacterized protein n=1 Tax=Amphiura filiformis TaxID=82378 RepID=UPI003B226A19
MSHRADLDTECEILWAQLELVGSKRILLGAFYRPPESGSDILDQLQLSLSKIDVNKDRNILNIWVAGDFNLSHIDWENQTTIPGCPKPGLSRQLIELSNDFGLEQVVREPTRGSNILDLFFMSNPTLMDRVRILPGMSDHTGIPLVTINTRPKVNRSKPRRIHLYHKADWSAIKEDLTYISSDFQDICSDMVTVDDLWDDFCTRVKGTMDKNIPNKVVTPHKSPPWFNRNVSRIYRKKKKAFNKAKHSNNTDDWEIFRSLRKELNRQSRRNYRQYVRDTCSESMKKFYSFIKSLKKTPLVSQL